MADQLSSHYRDLLDGSYDCVDRIVLNAYFGLCYSAGGFRCWWRRLHDGSDDDLDNTHLMRMAGRFSRRVRAFAKANGIPAIACSSEEKKHPIAEQHLHHNPAARGLFLVLVSRAVATVWDVKRSSAGKIHNLEAKRPYINHYSFHIMDPDWGHITIKMSGHPPFGTQIILNGHEYVACRARQLGLDFTKEGNCFTIISRPADLAKVADALSDSRTVGRLSQVCERWIYTSCLCFALDLEEQQRSGFRYEYSVYQGEYSRNLVFHRGAQMEQVFQALIDRTRAQLNLKRLRTIFGFKKRPHRNRKGKPPRLEVVVETPAYDLTICKLHFVGGAGLGWAGWISSGREAALRCQPRWHWPVRQRASPWVSSPPRFKRYCQLPTRPTILGTPKMGRKPWNWGPIDEHYELLRRNTGALFKGLGIAA